VEVKKTIDLDNLPPNCLLRESEAAAAITLSPSHLRQLRSTGGGPVYIKLSPRSVRYRAKDLVKWRDSFKPIPNTQTDPLVTDNERSSKRNAQSASVRSRRKASRTQENRLEGASDE
jgi:hypothetical protein